MILAGKIKDGEGCDLREQARACLQWQAAAAA
jgi:hypothetical protein